MVTADERQITLPAPLEQALEDHAAAALERMSTEDPARYAALADRQLQLSAAYALLWAASRDGDNDTAVVARARIFRLTGEIQTGAAALRRMALVKSTEVDCG